jgi:hypothetical protein
MALPALDGREARLRSAVSEVDRLPVLELSRMQPPVRVLG